LYILLNIRKFCILYIYIYIECNILYHFHLCNTSKLFATISLDSYAASFCSNTPARYSRIRLISFKISTRRRCGIRWQCNRAIQLAVLGVKLESSRALVVDASLFGAFGLARPSRGHRSTGFLPCEKRYVSRQVPRRP